jgi:uncharacterized protein
MRILNTIQTNGVLLDDEWAAFFKKNEFLVGISIDGPREMHDAYRVDKGGEPTFDRVIKGLGYLQKHEVEFNVLTTVHAANGDHPVEVYRFLRDEVGAEYIQFIPIIERGTPETMPLANKGWGGTLEDRPLYINDGSMVTVRSIGAEQYGNFLVGVFDEWVRHDVGQVYVQISGNSGKTNSRHSLNTVSIATSDLPVMVVVRRIGLSTLQMVSRV